MSFATNNIFVESIGFNGAEVKSLYYNNVLVWGFTWEDSSWEDLYNVCKMKQAGTLTEWPESIQIGNIKTCKTRINNTDYTWYMRLIGIDIDAPGTLTFETITLPDYRDDDNYTISYANYIYGCMKYHADLNPKESPYYYIKELEKQYELLSLDNQVRVVKVHTWPLSMNELGYRKGEETKDFSIADLYTVGVNVPYQYYDVDDVDERRKRRKKYYYEDNPSIVGTEGWYRDNYNIRRLYGNNNGACYTDGYGDFKTVGMGYRKDTAFAFTIG